MSCTEVGKPLQELLDELAEHVEVPGYQLDGSALEVAERYGWVFEFEGVVALTGAGAHHASGIRPTGLLD